MEDKIVVKNVSKMFGKEKVLDNVLPERICPA